MQRKRERDGQTKKKALTSKREGRGCVVKGGEPRLQLPLCFWPSYLRAGLWAGAHPGRGEGRGHGVGGTGNPSCRTLRAAGQAGSPSSSELPPLGVTLPQNSKRIFGLGDPHPRVLVISTSSWLPTWLGATCPRLWDPWTIGLLLITLGKVIQVAHVTRFHAHEARKALHVIIPADWRPGVRAGIRGCGLGPRRAGRHSRGTALPQQHPGQSEA